MVCGSEIFQQSWRGGAREWRNMWTAHLMILVLIIMITLIMMIILIMMITHQSFMNSTLESRGLSNLKSNKKFSSIGRSCANWRCFCHILIALQPNQEISILTKKSIFWPQYKYFDHNINILTTISIFWPQYQYFDHYIVHILKNRMWMEENLKNCSHEVGCPHSEVNFFCEHDIELTKSRYQLLAFWRQTE